MPDESDAAVSNAAWIELLHAEVCWHLDRADVDALVIKGPSIADWLYPDEERPSADVDLLVRPSHWRTAIDVLHKLGFADTLEDFKEWEPPHHSVTLSRTDPELGGHAVDLHRFFPGIDLEGEPAFDVLWSDRTRGTQAALPVWYPSTSARTLIIALHAARDPSSPKTGEDLRRAVRALDDDERAHLTSLARQLSAQAALRAGLESQSDTADEVSELGLSNVPVSAYWALRSRGASGTSIHLEELTTVPWSRRPITLWHWVFPSPALMRVRDPRAASGRAALAGAYARRLRSGVRALPAAVRELRAARRPHG